MCLYPFFISGCVLSAVRICSISSSKLIYESPHEEQMVAIFGIAPELASTRLWNSFFSTTRFGRCVELSLNSGNMTWRRYYFLSTENFRFSLTDASTIWFVRSFMVDWIALAMGMTILLTLLHKIIFELLVIAFFSVKPERHSYRKHVCNVCNVNINFSRLY